MSRSSRSVSRSGAVDRAAQTRCAIYTRKSSEEGLEQEFNSLDAQREACEAYVLSQKHEGWLALPTMYDDGGISGGTLERPALKRLMEDIEAGRVDTVVVYKVDRLTRSLNDFAKIVEVFDRKAVSFVSVTQQFNTTTSMGRLTLNMLLSFAQFEREVTGERIRDKIAASKKKGLWMGGYSPLGYDVKDRKLMIHPTEAATVVRIYERYLETGSVLALKAALDTEDIRSKRRVDHYGRETGGRPFSRGALYRLLQNALYRGQILHKGASYPGQHEAIVPEALWSDVQRHLAENRVARRNGVDTLEPSLLAGLLYDDTGDRLVPTHANKRGRRYRYYVSQGLINGATEEVRHGRRVPAADLESLIEARLIEFLKAQTELHSALPASVSANERAQLIQCAEVLATRWPSQPPAEKRSVLCDILHRVDLHSDKIEVHVQVEPLLRTLLDLGRPRAGTGRLATTAPPPSSTNTDRQQVSCIQTLCIAARLRRVGLETRLIIAGPSHRSRHAPDAKLKRLIAQAHHYRALLMQHGGKTVTDLAREAGVSSSYFTRIVRLSFLAPDIVQAILRDRHPFELNANRLAKRVRLPASWDAQRALLGVGS